MLLFLSGRWVLFDWKTSCRKHKQLQSAICNKAFFHSHVFQGKPFAEGKASFVSRQELKLFNYDILTNNILNRFNFIFIRLIALFYTII